MNSVLQHCIDLNFIGLNLRISFKYLGFTARAINLCSKKRKTVTIVPFLSGKKNEKFPYPLTEIIKYHFEQILLDLST